MKKSFSEFYGKLLTTKPTPREHYFAENEQEEIIINKIITEFDGLVHWRDKSAHHWQAPIGDLSNKERTREPNLHNGGCYEYNENPTAEKVKKVTKKKKVPATAA